MNRSHPLIMRSRNRGFTLVELMAVVMIVAILAAIAIPLAGRAVRERRSAAAAQQVASTYRLARMRSIARGAAVLVRYTSGRFVTREAIVGTAGAGNCALATVSSCQIPTNRWVDASGLYREIGFWDPPGEGNYEGVQFEFTENTAATSNVRAATDLCFTPSGRTFYRPATTGAFSLLTGPPSVRVWMEAGGEVIGITRTVFLLPNGMARIAI